MEFGPGVNLGHQNIVKHLPGVKDATVWTCPTENKCYVLVEKVTEQKKIEAVIKERLHEITGKSTNVFFASNQEEIDIRRSTMPHRATISRTDDTSKTNMQFSVDLWSNPNYTGSLLVACARAAVAMHREGNVGVITFEDIPPKYFKPCGDINN